jgi:hypothetical protein
MLAGDQLYFTTFVHAHPVAEIVYGIHAAVGRRLLTPHVHQHPLHIRTAAQDAEMVLLCPSVEAPLLEDPA